MRTVILVPRRADDGRRDELYAFVKTWLTRYHPDYEIVEGGCSDGAPFNRGMAVNDAARRAGTWDVAVIHDGDNITAPEKLVAAVEHAHKAQVMTFACRAYYYLDRPSSDRIMAGPEHWWVEPQIWSGKAGYREYLIHKHVSGIQAVPRAVWDRTGGFVENLVGWGSDDSIFTTLCNTLGGGVEWLDGIAYHLNHDHDPADIDRRLVSANRQKLMQLKRLERMYPRNPKPFRDYLTTLGHRVP